MKKRLVKALLILMVCSIFLINKDSVMSIIKNATAATNASFKGTVTIYGTPEEAIKSGPIYNSRVKLDLGTRIGTSWNGVEYTIPQVSDHFILNDGWTINYVSVAGYSSGNRQPGASFLLGMSGGSMVYWFKKKSPMTDTEKFTLKYDANGGTNPPEVETIERGTIVTIKNDNDSKMTNVNHEFLGWSVNPEATIADWKPNDKMPMNSNVTLYAVWNKIVDNGRGISVDKTRIAINGDSKKLTAEAGDDIIWNITITNNSNVSKNITINEELMGANLSIDSFTLPAEKTIVVTAAYTVKKNDNGILYNTIRVNDGTEDKNISDEGTLIFDGEYNVKWVDEGGTILDWKIIYDKDSIPTTEVKPTKAEDEDYTYEFAGWRGPIIDSYGNITYVATYTSHKKNEETEPTYTVIYKDEFNSFSSQETYALQEGTTTPKFKEEPGKTQILEDGAIVPIRDGYRFIGWSKRINKVVSAEDANENYEIIYVANWQKMDTSPNEDITPPQIINKDNSNKIDNPLTEDKIFKYITSGIISLLLIIIIILKNKKSIKDIFSNNKNSFF